LNGQRLDINAPLARQLYEEHKNLSKVAELLGCARATAKNAIVKAGGTIALPGGRTTRRKLLSPREMEEAKILVTRDGWGYKRLAAKYGLAFREANQIRVELGKTPSELRSEERAATLAELRNDLRAEQRTAKPESFRHQMLEERIDALNYALERVRYIKLPNGEHQ